MNQRLSISLLLGVIFSVSVFVAFALAGGSNGVALADDVSPLPPPSPTLEVGDMTTNPSEPLVMINEPLSFTAVFTDPPPSSFSNHTAVWDWGDGSSSNCEVGEPIPISVSDADPCWFDTADHRVYASHKYAHPDIYTVHLKVTPDNDEVLSGESVLEFVVVYDPDGGFVTGGGWIDSPVNADYQYMQAGGKATFGFVSKYKKGANAPTGNTEFQFKAGDLNFHSDSYDWLVVANHKATYKGVGTINGNGNYGFMLSAIDEKLTPSTDVDLFRIKIWTRDNADAIVYDNQMGDADDADPTTAIDGGSIVIHKGK